MVRILRIELRISVWQTDSFPLAYIRMKNMHSILIGWEGGTRTHTSGIRL